MSYLVVMDRPGRSASKTFYRRLSQLRGVMRIQQSTYLVNDREDLRALIRLGEEHGFDVRVFRGEEILT